MSAALAHLSASIGRSRFPVSTKVIIKGLPLQFFFFSCGGLPMVRYNRNKNPRSWANLFHSIPVGMYVWWRACTADAGHSLRSREKTLIHQTVDRETVGAHITLQGLFDSQEKKKYVFSSLFYLSFLKKKRKSKWGKEGERHDGVASDHLAPHLYTQIYFQQFPFIYYRWVSATTVGSFSLFLFGKKVKKIDWKMKLICLKSFFFWFLCSKNKIGI